MDTPLHLNPRRLVRQIAFCDPQIRHVFCGSRKQFSCQPTEAGGEEGCPGLSSLDGFDIQPIACGFAFPRAPQDLCLHELAQITSGRGGGGLGDADIVLRR